MVASIVSIVYRMISELAITLSAAAEGKVDVLRLIMSVAEVAVIELAEWTPGGKIASWLVGKIKDSLSTTMSAKTPIISMITTALLALTLNSTARKFGNVADVGRPS